MSDPLSEVVTLLQPRVLGAKLSSAAGPWRLRHALETGPFFCAVLEGAFRFRMEGEEALLLTQGDFVMMPAGSVYEGSSLEPPEEPYEDTHRVLDDGEVRHGRLDGPADVRLVVGFCETGSSDASLLVSLLPRFICVRGEPRFATLLQLVREEARASRPGRELILTRLLEVVLLEAFRATPSNEMASPGLIRGLADEHLAVALRRMHEEPARDWSVTQLAREAALSRSAFFERFQREVGSTPMGYLSGWRMALARELLSREEELTMAEVAERVGYSSASTFSVAFTRQVGEPPSHYARAHRSGEREVAPLHQSSVSTSGA